jgi:hypothetical protein
MIMGAGGYTVAGYVDIGSSAGGDVYCNGINVGVYANNVTFVVGASSTPTGGCSGMALCVGNGFASVTVVAPSTGTNEGLAVIEPQSSLNAAGASFGQGAANAVVNGLFYVPNGPFNMSGGASLRGGGGCLQIVASQVTLSGGAAAATCPSLGVAPSAYTARLVQ